MTKNYKILASYIKDVSSKINDTENFIYLKENMTKFSLGIDISSFPLKNNMAEVNMKLIFDDKSTKNKKAYFEMLHTTVIRVEESAVNKDELKKVFLSHDINLNEKLAFSCGSGITACVLGLASTVINNKLPVIYDGSWAEYGLK